MPTLRHINGTGLLVALTLALAAMAAAAYADTLYDLQIETRSTVHDFKVEVMRSADERARGLMHRKHLPEDRGMLFDFGGKVTARMWMKNTFIPLDMLFIRGDGTITNIARDTVPHSTEVLSSDGNVRYVLEINAGLSQRLGIQPGDKVTLPKLGQ